MTITLDGSWGISFSVMVALVENVRCRGVVKAECIDENAIDA